MGEDVGGGLGPWSLMNLAVVKVTSLTGPVEAFSDAVVRRASETVH